MPPQLASLLTFAFIAFLFWRDVREKPDVTGALWLPVLWMLDITSKSVTEWLRIIFGVSLAASSEGAMSVNAVVWFALIIAGIYVLRKRQVTTAEIVRNNGWLSAFLLYAFLAVFWSDVPFTSFKHWVAILGHPIMTLIILTEPDPEEALKRLMKRSAYVLIPVSLLLVRYYPQWGAYFGLWGNYAARCGIADGKNSLGVICMILGIFFSWHLLTTRRLQKSKGRRNEIFLCIGFLYMIGLLYFGLNCGTALTSMAVGVLVLVLVGLPAVNKRQFIGTYLLAFIAVLVAAELTFGLREHVTELLGKDPTLTGRTEMWKELVEFDINPVVGAGFESFWEGKRLKILWERHWWKPNEAHNGYLEIYLNLGLIGLLLMSGCIVATFPKGRSELLRNFELGQFRLAFLPALVIYNWSESGFKLLNPIWFVFYLVAMDYPKPMFSRVEESAEALVEAKDANPTCELSWVGSNHELSNRKGQMS